MIPDIFSSQKDYFYVYVRMILDEKNWSEKVNHIQFLPVRKKDRKRANLPLISAVCGMVIETPSKR